MIGRESCWEKKENIIASRLDAVDGLPGFAAGDHEGNGVHTKNTALYCEGVGGQFGVARGMQKRSSRRSSSNFAWPPKKKIK